MLVNLRTIRPHKRDFVTFSKGELNAILGLYSFQVVKGHWRDYAIYFKKDMAVFSIFRSAHETPLVTVVKLAANTTTGFVFEIFFERQQLSRTPELSKALDGLHGLLV